ncbi:MAG TPA: glutamate-cysteine ligase family protein, partial [Alphaproteobacteria bacterium]|nr:glutamate-cysteine ligase family protein [Alphaproteobacteria bacterium]
MTGAIAAKINETEAPLTINDLMEYMVAGCKAPDAWRIGTEHEKFLYRKDTRAPVTYESPDGKDIKTLLQVLADRHAWTLVREGEMIVGVTKGKYSINLEPGGQIELSGAPLPDIHLVARELHTYLDEVRKICADLDIGIMGIGLRPKVSEQEIPPLNRPRYKALFSDENYANHQRWGMLTAAVQCNMDYSSETDMIKKFRVSLALQPVVTALFANSPFYRGRPSGNLSQRYHFVQTDTQQAQRSVIETAFDTGFDFQSYIDFATSRPVRFILE